MNARKLDGSARLARRRNGSAGSMGAKPAFGDGNRGAARSLREAFVCENPTCVEHSILLGFVRTVRVAAAKVRGQIRRRARGGH